MKELHYDVVVCGAGVAGVAAAVAAARAGAKTAVIEKQCLLGGLATSGLIYIYLPLCDGNGKIVYKHMGYNDGEEIELYEKVKEAAKK